MNISNRILLLRMYLLKQEIKDAKRIHKLQTELDKSDTYKVKSRTQIYDDLNKNSFIYSDIYYNPKTNNAITIKFNVQAGHLKQAVARKLTPKEAKQANLK